ncbi:MAG TPA: hypothetical protein VF371_02310, partial [Candidatus Limnocylindrales bacterium]
VVVRGPAGEVDVALVRSVVRVFDPARGEIVVDGEALGLRGDAVADPAEAEETAVGAPEAAGD